MTGSRRQADRRPQPHQSRNDVTGGTTCQFSRRYGVGAAIPEADRKIIRRKWARGSGPGPGVVIGPSQGRYGLYGLGDGDGEAEGLDLPELAEVSGHDTMPHS